MERIRNVPVIEVNRDNLKTLFPAIVLRIRCSTFLALDAELSGLGDRQQLNARSIDDRYKSISAAARSRSVISLGLSCFSRVNETDESRARVFNTETYNFFTLCDDDFVVEPGAVQFLVDHGFDFNLQYAKGLPYRRGFQSSRKDKENFALGDLIAEILAARKPIVFHNGLVDLIFFYGNFVAELPSSLQTFVADLMELFPRGVYDTKFVADYCARYQASYLEYVFRKCQRENEKEANSGQPYVHIRLPRFTPSIEKWVEWAVCSLPQCSDSNVANVCPIFASHGWCKHGLRCSLSHDVDAVLDMEEQKSAKSAAKRRRRNAKRGEINSTMEAESEERNTISVRDSPENLSAANSKSIASPVDISHEKISDRAKWLPLYTGAHRAGYDAFMTGFSLACFSLKLHQCPLDCDAFDVSAFKNKIALSGKDHPLFIQASSFSKPSQKMQDIVKQLFTL